LEQGRGVRIYQHIPKIAARAWVHVPYFQVPMSNLHGNSKTSLPGAVLHLDATPTTSNILQFLPSRGIVRILPQTEYLSVL
jgi:hypothetical protein